MFDVNIVEMPLDIASLAATLAATFLGALAAFALNYLYWRARDREEKRHKINKSVGVLAMNLNSLMLLKKQFLLSWEKEFTEMHSKLGGLNFLARDIDLGAVVGDANDVFIEIGKKDEIVGGVFKPWDGVVFVRDNSPEDLLFFAEDSPDLIRLLTVANNQIAHVSKNIEVRNAYREANITGFHKEHETGQFTSQSPLFIYHMLDYRFSIRHFSDVALVTIDFCLEQIDILRVQRFRKRGWLIRKLFGAEKWLSAPPNDARNALVPDRKNYADFLIGVE